MTQDNDFDLPAVDRENESATAESSPRKWSLWGACLVAVVLVVARVLPQPIEQLPPREAEDARQKAQKVASIFGSGATPEDVSRHQVLNATIEQLRLAFVSRDAAELGRLFDSERMLQEILRVESFDFTSRQLHQINTQLAQMLPRRLIEHADFYAFERFELKRVEFNDDGTEAVLYVREWDADNIAIKMRWWVMRDDAGWRFFDFEDLSTSMRFSNLGALGMLLAWKNPTQVPVLQRQMQTIVEATRATIEADIETAKRALSRIESESTLPQPLQALVQMINATVAIAEGDPQTGLARCDAAEALNPDLVILAYLRALALNQQERYVQARQQAELFLEKLGGDADGSMELATALQGLGRDEQALQVIREGLADDPSSVNLLVMLGHALPEGREPELGEGFTRLPQPQEWFDTVCAEFFYRAEPLEALIEAYRPLAPEDPDLAYYQAQVHLLREQPALAATILEAVLPVVKDRDDFEYFEDLYHEALLADGRWHEIYSVATDKTEAFAQIADHLLYQDDSAPLEQLIALHREQAPDDPRLHGYIGRLAEQNEDWPRAIEAYRTAVDGNPDSDWWYSLVQAMFYGDRALEALTKVEPADVVFRQLMYLADGQEPRPIELMDSLVEAFDAEKPEDAAAPYWRSRLAYLRQDYAGAAELLQQHAEVIGDDEYLAWEFHQMLVNCLVRLEHFDEAHRQAQRIYADDGDPFPAAIVAAAQGDLEQTTQWLHKCVNEAYYDLDDFYENEILAAALRSEAFKTLREQYPPPEIDPPIDVLEQAPPTTI
jgi:tetratricopeptide (TPR) repeat protein